MKVIHWVKPNTSGMHRVAASMARAELTLGVESRCMDPFDPAQTGWAETLDADVHVNHTHLPDQFQGKSFKRQCTKPHLVVFPVHGTPELVFEMSVREAETNGYNAGTGLAQHQRGMQEADAIMAFVPRHRDLYKLATDKRTIVDLIPMGVDHEFWKNGVSFGHYAGRPAFFNCENAYAFKWAVDFLRVWPWVREELDDAVLHVSNIPVTLQRFVDVLIARTGAIYGTVAGSWSYDQNNLRNIFRQVDFYLSTVRYGDFNRLSMEAGAAGLPVISYPGNDYADYWMQEGDSRFAVRDLIAIGKGEVQPRADKKPVPTEAEMAHATINVYERLLDRPQTNWAVGAELADALDPIVRDALLSATGPGLNGVAPSAPRPKASTASELLSSYCAGVDAAAQQVAALAGELASVEVPPAVPDGVLVGATA